MPNDAEARIPLEDRLRGLEAIKGAALAFSSSLDLDQVLSHVVQRVRLISGSDLAVAFLLDSLQSTLVARAASPSSEALGLHRLDGLHSRVDSAESLGIMGSRGLVFLESEKVAALLEGLPVQSQVGQSPAAIVRLVVEGKTIGFVFLSGLEKKDESGGFQTWVLGALVDHAAVAIGNALSYEEAKRREMEATFLLEAAIPLDSSQDLPNVLQNIVDEAVGVIGEWCSIYLIEGKTGELTSVASSNSGRVDAAENIGRIGSSIASLRQVLADVSADGKPHFRRFDEDERNRSENASIRQEDIKSLLAVPILDNGKMLGILCAATFEGSPYEVSERELRLASGLAERAAVGMVNLQLLEIVARGKREWEETFDAIADGIFISDSACNLLRANKAFASLLSAHPKDVVGKKCFELLWERSDPCEACQGKALYLAAPPNPVMGTIDLDLGEREMQITIYPVLDSSTVPTAFVHIVKDVTERNKLQDIIIRSEKLRAIGELASGVAHDFNNLLASIVGWSEVALKADVPSQLLPSITAINQAALDGAEAVKRIQEYTRISRDTEFTIIDLNEVTRGAVEFARPLWKDRSERAGIPINLSVEFTSITPVLGNASDLREVLVNIIFNAIDAMKHGGEIRIRTGMLDDRVFVEIADSGSGMPEEVRRKVFDPFFTTKGSSGSGLGLSVAYGIIARHGGDITVESQLGQGSKFVVLLPATEYVQPELPSEEDQASEPVNVLLVDDDPRVLGVVAAMLQSLGHKVTACQGGEAGIRAFRQSGYDLVITDLGMPDANGYEVAAAVKSAAPGTPVVLLTGWGREIALGQLSEIGIEAVIPKPCRIPVLRKTIRDVLMRPRARSHASAGLSERVTTVDSSLNSSAVYPLRILIVEDNKMFGEALRERLEIDGHEAFLASTGGAGLDALRRERFDLVLCDLKLPDMSGLNIVPTLNGLQARPFIALMSGYAVSQDEQALLGKGVDAVLPKPWKEEELNLLLRRVCQKELTK